MKVTFADAHDFGFALKSSKCGGVNDPCSVALVLSSYLGWSFDSPAWNPSSKKMGFDLARTLQVVAFRPNDEVRCYWTCKH